MNIVVTNDGKGSDRSFVAVADQSDNPDYGFYHLEAQAFGANSEEAVENLKKMIAQIDLVNIEVEER